MSVALIRGVAHSTSPLYTRRRLLSPLYKYSLPLSRVHRQPFEIGQSGTELASLYLFASTSTLCSQFRRSAIVAHNHHFDYGIRAHVGHCNLYIVEPFLYCSYSVYILAALIAHRPLLFHENPSSRLASSPMAHCMPRQSLTRH